MGKLDDSEEKAIDLVRYMVRSIIGPGVDLELKADYNPGEFCINVHVPADVRGRIIGRHGRAARSMRNVLSAANLDLSRRATLDIVD